MSCRAIESSNFDPSDLLGRWELESARVNGSETDRLRDLYYVFLPDTSFQSNILGSERNYPYVLKDKVIVQHGETPISYEIISMVDDLLVLQATIRGSVFLMDFTKAGSKSEVQ